METFWFMAVAFMITMYVLLDGFDLGAGAIPPFVARNDDERRMIIRAFGPVWEGNEVWLIAAGGTLFFAFPQLYASSFSGFYLPLIMVLWLLMIRGLSIELRSHLKDPLWASFWEAAFFFGSALLVIFFGAALGNVVRGVPVAEDGYFFQPLWTNFSPTNPNPGILDWYTVLTGLLALSTLVAHGASLGSAGLRPYSSPRSPQYRPSTCAPACSPTSPTAHGALCYRPWPSVASPGWVTSTSRDGTKRPSSRLAPTSSAC